MGIPTIWGEPTLAEKLFASFIFILIFTFLAYLLIILVLKLLYRKRIQKNLLIILSLIVGILTYYFYLYILLGYRGPGF